MQTCLSTVLAEAGVSCTLLRKTEKVRLMARWSRDFAELSAASRYGVLSAEVMVDAEVDVFISALAEGMIYILPNDESGMPTVHCKTGAVAELAKLMDDSRAGCEEIVVVDEAFGWSCVFVNHGAAGVGRYASGISSK